MLALRFTDRDKELRTALFLGAHCDDVEIGCGGTMLRLIEDYPDVSIRWVVFSSSPERAAETRRAAESLLAGARHSEVVVKSFRNGFFPFVGAEIKEYFEALKAEVDPDVIFTHYRGDRHQDHRTISDLTWNTFRSHLILEYEIAKYDGDLGRPNLFVPVSEQAMRQKVETLMRCYPTQAGKQWFTPDTFKGLMRLRGIECDSPTGFAEAFHARKLMV